MHCKVATIFLLCITAINGNVISRFSFQIHPSEAIAQPSRHLLPPYEDQVGSQLYANDIFRSAQSVEQLIEEKPTGYEEFAPQPFLYEVVNRVLPHEEGATDFQPLEQQMTKAAEDVQSVQQTVNDFENYLQGVAATLPPQNKPKNEVVLIITTKISPMREEASTGGLAERELENLLSSLFAAEAADGDSTEEERAYENRLSSMLEQDYLENVYVPRLKELINERKEATDNDNADEEKEFEKFISNAFEEEDSTESDNARDFSQKAIEHNDDVEEAVTISATYLDQLFDAAALAENPAVDYFDKRFLSRFYLNDDFVIR